jgi:tRNA threonylcarbamoyladenosine biosynthesis protein TsaE
MKMDFHLSQLATAADALHRAMLQKPTRVLALHGPMGAGKTTLTIALLRQLGSTDHGASPTFSIVNEYRLPAGEKLLHMDWYRLADEEEALAAGVEELLYSGAWCVVEWPEKAGGLLPENTLHAYLDVTGEQSRILHLPNEQ